MKWNDLKLCRAEKKGMKEEDECVCVCVCVLGMKSLGANEEKYMRKLK